MPLNEIRFNKNGGPITVEIPFGYAQAGAYTLVLWDATGSKKQQIGEGVNTDQIPDLYTLPQPNSNNDGCILDCVATVVAPNPRPGEQFRVDMIVRQDGQELGREFDEGPIDGKSVSTRLAAKLVS